MPFSIIWEKQGSVTIYSGTVDISEVFEADRVFYNDPRSDYAEYQIIDFTLAMPGIVEENLIEHIAAIDYGASRSIPCLNVAFITEDPYVKGLCNQYIKICMELGLSWTFMIFENMDNARIWVSERSGSK